MHAYVLYMKSVVENVFFRKFFNFLLFKFLLFFRQNACVYIGKLSLTSVVSLVCNEHCNIVWKIHEVRDACAHCIWNFVFDDNSSHAMHKTKRVSI